MKRYLIVVLFLVGQISFGQAKNIQVPIYRQKDTTLWYTWTKENIQKIGLQNLIKTTQPLHFRFWTERQVIDIWTVDNTTFEGKFISYTKKYDPDKTDKPKPEKFYSKVYDIDTATARTIYQFAYNQRLFEVPFQDSIKGWSHGLDGDTYLVEYSTPTHYSFKDYWTPQIQKGINEAAIIDSVDKFLKAILHMDTKWSSFERATQRLLSRRQLIYHLQQDKTKKKEKLQLTLQLAIRSMNKSPTINRPVQHRL